jgi:hypothetical protein
LLEAVARCDRLVLLGDLIELRHGPERDALAAARGLLTALGAALGPEREVVIVPGNHDHRLLDDWFERQGRTAPPPPLGLQAELRWHGDELLATIAGWLAPARVSAAYPGLWLRPDVYAIHGHYADLHLTIPTLERLAAGVMSRIVRGTVDRPARGPASGSPNGPFGGVAGGSRTAEDYEVTLAPIYAWIHALAQRIGPELGGNLQGGSVRGWSALTGPGRRGLRRRAVGAGFPALVAALNGAGLGPLRPELSRAALRRAGLRGLEEAAGRLGVSASYVVFGHTHRAGPLPGDDPGEWRTSSGAQLINSGCWVSEPSLLGPAPAQSPYRVGFCVWVLDEGPPELVNLLDGRGA